jgi:hypothetical protein
LTFTNNGKTFGFGNKIDVKIFEYSINGEKPKIPLESKKSNNNWYSFTLPPINPDTSLSLELVYTPRIHKTFRIVEEESFFGESLTGNRRYLKEKEKKVLENCFEEIDEDIKNILKNSISLKLIDSKEHKIIDSLTLSGDNVNKTGSFTIVFDSIDAETNNKELQEKKK